MQIHPKMSFLEYLALEFLFGFVVDLQQHYVALTETLTNRSKQCTIMRGRKQQF